MIFDVLTLFPEMFEVFNHSIINKGREKELIGLNLFNIRDFTSDKHKKVDDYPYGGGSGMVMQAEPIYNSIAHITKIYGYKPYTILMTPRGEKFNQQIAKRLFSKEHIVLVCGHYEGIDERVLEEYNVKEISIGDYVLTGGELPAMVFIDSVTRLVPGIINEESLSEESHTNKLLEYPQYTKPSVFKGREVPEVLLSGHHKNIVEYRQQKSLELTIKNRPDLLK